MHEKHSSYAVINDPHLETCPPKKPLGFPPASHKCLSASQRVARLSDGGNDAGSEMSETDIRKCPEGPRPEELNTSRAQNGNKNQVTRVQYNIHHQILDIS